MWGLEERDEGEGKEWRDRGEVIACIEGRPLPVEAKIKCTRKGKENVHGSDDMEEGRFCGLEKGEEGEGEPGNIV